MTFSLSSTKFKNGETIPVEHTCDGRDVSPQLSWSDPPEGTVAFALIMDDPDAPFGVFTHWVMFNLPGASRALPEGVPRQGVLSGGGIQGLNDFGKLGYGGPCPPPGKPHTYWFRLHALSAELRLGAGSSKKDVMKTIQGRILGMAELTAAYGR